MRRSLLSFLVALPLLATPVLAEPPSTGSTYTFVDPIFQATVFCDSFEEVHAIATADEPVAVFQVYFTTPNHKNEPTCAAITTTAKVLSVRPLGVMQREEKRFNAWAIEAQVGEEIGFALYLEARTDIIV